MTWVKICGITNLEDALVAVEAGADAVGFVFYAPSPRNVHPDVVREITDRLPANVERVGVFADANPSNLMTKQRIIHQSGLTAIQVHASGSSPSSLRTLNELASLRARLFVAWPADRILKGRLGGFTWRGEASEKVSAIFFDSGRGKRPGGTGKSFDWQSAAVVLKQMNFKFVVAGGLNPQNVDEAMQILKPWGVDVASGVEAKPGKKDPEKVRAFVRAVRESDQRAG